MNRIPQLSVALLIAGAFVLGACSKRDEPTAAGVPSNGTTLPDANSTAPDATSTTPALPPASGASQ